MKYIISSIGKYKNKNEDMITQKYLQRVKNVQEFQYEVKLNDVKKKIEEEGVKLISSTQKNGKLILLDEQGENLTSAELAGIISNWKINNISSVNFAIGGAFGNGKTIKKAAEKIIALGRFTWPHQMVRMMVAEQIYRIETILQGHPYHK